MPSLPAVSPLFAYGDLTIHPGCAVINQSIHRFDEGTESFTFVFDPEPSMKIRSVQWLFAVD